METRIYTIQNACGVVIATVTGAANAARIFISCPDAWAIFSPGHLELDRSYLYEQGVSFDYSSVLGLLSTPNELDVLFGS
jgi:hypothetical protein